MDRNYVTHNGGSIKVSETPVPVFARVVFDDNSGIDTSCPFCLGTKVSECADFVQFGMLTDEHDMLLWCETCDRPFVLEFEVKE